MSRLIRPTTAPAIAVPPWLAKLVCFVAATLIFSRVAHAQPRHPIMQIAVNDDASGDPLPCRVHLYDGDEKPFLPPDTYPSWRDHFVCAGRAAFEIPAGTYRYEIERGPEHGRRSGNVTIRSDAPNKLSFTLPRIADLRGAGWYSGDLHVHRPVNDVELLMKAEDLDFAPVITWWNRTNPWNKLPLPPETTSVHDGHRIYDVMAGEDEREGGALLYFGLPRPIDITSVSREIPSPMKFVETARKLQPDVWIDIEKPFWWDVPVWLASGKMDSIGLANNHMCRSQMYENEAWGKPRDETRLPAPRGNGFWTQEIYYQILNAGIRIPPSAGSASGVLPNPVGYNRVYVHLGGKRFSRESWYEGLRGGRSFVTNGPLLVARAGGELPGHEFDTGGGKTRIDLDVRLTTLDPISQIELIQNGKVVKQADCNGQVDQQFRWTMEVSGGGWFLVRAITDVEGTFRFASTAPWYYTAVAGESPVNRESSRFFLDWTRERIARVERNVTGIDRLREVLAPHRRAESYWLEKTGSNVGKPKSDGSPGKTEPKR